MNRQLFGFSLPVKLNKSFFFVFAILLLLLSCDSSVNRVEHQKPFDPNHDYFPHKVTVNHAKGFRISYFNNYKVLELIDPFNKKAETVRYALVQRGTPHPKGFIASQIIEIPIRSLITLSSTHVALTDFLESNKIVVGLSDTGYVCNSEIRQLIKDKKIKHVGQSRSLNNELVISMNPDLLMSVGLPSNRSGNHQTLIESGIKVLVNSEWMETTALGRTEWVKLLAVLLNKEQLVNDKFTIVEHKYQEACRIVKLAKNKPTVFMGMNYKGTWFVPGGNSYMANLMKDAGANYHWKNTTSTGSLELSMEDIYKEALYSTHWFNPGKPSSLDEIIEVDIRNKKFKSLKTGNIFNYTKKECIDGGNDYWESGLVNPHLVLSDIIKVLHPELLPNYETVYYEKLKR